MFTHPEIMRAVYRARSEDLRRRSEAVRARRLRREMRIVLGRIAPRLRPGTIAIRSAAMRSP
jgi:hypothetical protein